MLRHMGEEAAFGAGGGRISREAIRKCVLRNFLTTILIATCSVSTLQRISAEETDPGMLSHI